MSKKRVTFVITFTNVYYLFLNKSIHKRLLFFSNVYICAKTYTTLLPMQFTMLQRSK